MEQKNVAFCFLVLLFVSGLSLAQKNLEQEASLPLLKPAGKPMATPMNINNITMWVQADGKSSHNPCGGCGVIYPRGTTGAVYQDGILWGGLVGDGQNILIRVGGARYSSGLRPGRIVADGEAENFDEPNVRIWRIRRDWQEADLTRDAAEFYNVSADSVTREQIDEVRKQYECDWNEWPWQKGAPFYDSNENGIMDEGEEPGLAYGDQVVWFVANDLDSRKTENLFGSPSIGIEMQVTLWAYNRTGNQSDEALSRLNEALQHIVFKRIRLIYKGGVDTPEPDLISKMYIGQWSDPDIGTAGDDLVGCDTVLNVGFVYNATSLDKQYNRFGLSPPSVGYVIIQGPVVFSPGHQAMFNFRMMDNYKNLSISSFIYLGAGSVARGVGEHGLSGYERTIRFYKQLRGYAPFSGPDIYYNHPPGVTPGPFPLSGDPMRGTGHLDGLGEDYSFRPGDRRIMCSTGPFSLVNGDTQEVIIAIVGGIGSGRLPSISVMKHHTKWAHTLAKMNFEISFKTDETPSFEKEFVPSDFRLYQNHPNPFNSGTEIRYDLPVKRNVKLTIYNLLGQVVKVLVDENQEARSHKIRWDGTNVRGERVPTGIYMSRLEAGSVVLTKKMHLLK